jgi:hypothetical protein
MIVSTCSRLFPGSISCLSNLPKLKRVVIPVLRNSLSAFHSSLQIVSLGVDDVFGLPIFDDSIV